MVQAFGLRETHALDANTWSNNRQVDSKTGAWKPATPDWLNPIT
jgi:hypothetical protein